MDRLRLAIIAALALAAVSCEPEEKEDPGKTDPVKPAGRIEQTISATLPQGWEWTEGASLGVFDDKYNVEYKREGDAAGTFKGSSFACDNYRALYPYLSKATIDAKGLIHLTIPDKVSPAKGQQPAMRFAGAVSGGSVALEPVFSTIRFHIGWPGVTAVKIKSRSDAGLAGNVSISASDAVTATADSLTLIATPAVGSEFEAGEYFLTAVAGTLSKGYELTLSTLKHGAVKTTVADQTVLPAGGALDLGDIDDAVAPTIGSLVIPIHFKQEDKLLDNSTDTGAGSAWPFDESKGTASTHAVNHLFHLTGSGYPVICTCDEYYLNSRGGIQLYHESPNAYFEFPAFANGRVKTVTASFGNLPAPYITDASGQIIPGGEPKSNLLSCTLYEWNLEGSKAGEPVRFVIGKSGGSQIMQFNVTYEMSDDEVENGVSSVTLSESSNASFGTGSISVSAQASFKAGASDAGVTCGIEYRDLMVPGDFHTVECSPADFKCSLSNLTGDRYAFRAWACSPKGWRVYSDEITAYTSCLKIDFWLNGAVNNPFSPGMKSGQSTASGLAGTEQTYNLKEGGMQLRTFVPASGTSYYIDINTNSACRVSSAGETLSPMTYFKFPAVQGKAIREVVVTRGGGTGKTYYICQDPSTPQSAEATRMSPTLTLSGSGSTGSVSCPMAAANTSYCLVFPEAVMYNVRNVHVVYETAAAFSGDPVPDDQTLNPDDPSADPSGTFDYSRLKSLGHPRVLIDRAGFSQIRSVVTSNRASNRFLCDVTDLIISYADKYVNSPVAITYTLDASGKRLLTQSRNAFCQLSVMAYAYQITGQTKYVTRCRKILDDVCSFSDWHPSHFLDVGEMSLGVAIAYDWLYDVLTTEEKVKIRTALVNFGLKAGLQYGPSKFYNSDGNWNQVCNGGMVAAAIAVYEKDKTNAYQSIEKAVETNRKAIGLMYSPDGNYAEGYGYWGYGTGFQSLMMQMYETAFGSTAGLADVEGFLKTAGYMQFMVGPCGPFNYADGGSSSESASVGMWWFAGHLKDKSLLCNEMRIYNKGKYGSGSDERLMPLIPAVVKDFNIDDFTDVRPSKNVWSGNGLVPVAMVHTGWNFDANDHYVGIKAGQANENHGHMDAGSFVYDALGQRWSADLPRPSYTTMENALGAAGGDFWSMGQKSMRWDIISMNNWCHSTISVAANDGSISKTYPTDHNVKGKCTILSVLDSSTEKGAVLDMSAPLQGQVASARRTVKLVGEKDLYVIDEITALSGQDAPLYWHMVTPAAATASADGITLTSGGKTMYLGAAVSGAALTPAYDVLECARPSSWNARTWDPSLTAYHIAECRLTVPAGASVTLTVKLSPDR